ncbi:MAG: hypothetical protein H0X16_03980 [Chloroflexi bacterium]|nr:hypothetical protein [Chloroflexota bacterium]
MKEGREPWTGALIQGYRHKTWGTLSLIEHCRGLDSEHLDATMPGTYGTIRDTLRHLVSSDEDYLSQLARVKASESPPDGPVPLDQPADRFRISAPHWEALAEDVDLQAREVIAPDGWRFPAAILMAQAIHHADDHRTQVLSILGECGLEVPRLDVWGYAASHGLLTRSAEPWYQARDERPGGSS